MKKLRNKITQEEFIQRAIDNRGINRKIFDRFFEAYPCECNYEGCQGWGIDEGIWYDYKSNYTIEEIVELSENW